MSSLLLCPCSLNVSLFLEAVLDLPPSTRCEGDCFAMVPGSHPRLPIFFCSCIPHVQFTVYSVSAYGFFSKVHSHLQFSLRFIFLYSYPLQQSLQCLLQNQCSFLILNLLVASTLYPNSSSAFSWFSANLLLQMTPQKTSMLTMVGSR